MKQQAVRSPILGSFEDIGKDIVGEAVKAPTDIGEKIIESLTGSSSTKSQQQQKPEEAKIDKSVARAALQQLATPKQQQQEPSIFEKQTQEQKEKKEMEKKQKEKIAMQELPKMSSKKRRGDLYGIQGKASLEKSRNVRQD